MAYLAIDPARVRFNGCKHGFFATGPDPLHPDRYLITYPVDAKNRALAPITHELAHVMQMEIAGGREQLERQQRKPMQIELGADFISGIVFAAKFGNLNRGEFQNNLALTGEYDADSDPHGEPSERDAAFRYGLNFSFRKDVPDVRVASSYFRDVLYEEVINQSSAVSSATYSADAQIRLDKLTQCKEIADTYNELLSPATQNECRAPRTSMETFISKHAGARFGSICFDNRFNGPLFSGFSCIYQSNSPTVELICVRPATLSAIEDFKHHYDKDNATRAVNYGQSAEKCKIFSGDVGPTQPTLYPPLLTTFSRFELGFIASLTRDHLASYVLHAFASTDPSLSDGAPTALEVLYFLAGGSVAQGWSNGEEVNGWLVSMSDDADLVAALKPGSRSSYARSVSFEIRRPYDPNRSSSHALQKVVDDVSPRIEESLADEGFEEAAQKAKLHPSDLFQKQIPYGLRSILSVQNPTIIQMGRHDRKICRDPGDGGVLATLITVGPDAGPEKDVAQITLVLEALGSCEHLTPGARSYVRNLCEDIVALVRGYLRSEEAH